MNKEKLAAFHRENIINAADRLFLNDGIEATTVDSIAKSSECCKATIYAYFKSKEELYTHALYKHMLELERDFKAILVTNTTFKELYLALCRTMLDFKKNNGVYFEALLGKYNFGNDAAEMQSVIAEMSRKIDENLYKLYDIAVREQLIDAENNVDFVILHMWNAITGVINISDKAIRFFLSEDSSQDEFMEYSFDALLNGVLKRNK